MTVTLDRTRIKRTIFLKRMFSKVVLSRCKDDAHLMWFGKLFHSIAAPVSIVHRSCKIMLWCHKLYRDIVFVD